MENYRGFSLNQYGDPADCGTRENTLFKGILDFLPQSGSIMGGSHIHSALYDTSETAGADYAISCTGNQVIMKAGTTHATHVVVEDGSDSGANVSVFTTEKAVNCLLITHSNAVWDSLADGALLSLSATAGVGATNVFPLSNSAGVFTDASLAIKIRVNGTSRWVKLYNHP